MTHQTANDSLSPVTVDTALIPVRGTQYCGNSGDSIPNRMGLLFPEFCSRFQQNLSSDTI